MTIREYLEDKIREKNKKQDEIENDDLFLDDDYMTEIIRKVKLTRVKEAKKILREIYYLYGFKKSDFVILDEPQLQSDCEWCWKCVYSITKLNKKDDIGICDKCYEKLEG